MKNMNGTAYLFLPFLKELELIPTGILCLAAGGGIAPQCKLRFIIIGCNNSPELSEEVEKYKKAKLQTQEIGEWPEMPDLLPPIFLEGEHTPESYQGILNKLELPDLNPNDRFVVVSTTSDMHSLALHNALASQEWMENYKGNIQDVCMVTYEQGGEKERKANIFRSQRWLKGSPTVFTGIREDAYRKGMTMMETIVSIASACQTTLSGIPIHKELIPWPYTINELPSQNARESIIRMKRIYDISRATSSNDPCLKTWKKNFGIDSGDIMWKSGKPFDAINDLMIIFSDLIRNIPTDHFSFPEEKEETLFSKLNTLPNLTLKGLTEQNKRIKRVRTLLELANESPKSVTTPANSYEQCDIGEANDEVFTIALEKGSPSPTSPWGIMSLAFTEECSSLQQAALFRSMCLDMWELFFRHSESEVTQLLNVEELDLEKAEEINKQTLNQTETGKRMMEERWLFKIQGEGFVAYSSPLTGFAFDHLPQTPIVIGNHCYFDCRRPKELEMRSSDIRKFIFEYINSIGGFDKNFSTYVNNQIPPRLRHEAESKGKNLFKLYPDLRSHIGAEPV